MLDYCARQIIYSVFPAIQTEMKLSSVQLGLLSATFLWTYALMSPISGFVADRFGRRKVILGSLVVWSLGTWVTLYCANFHQLLATRALVGISEAFYLPAGLAMIADYHGERSRSLATGIHQSGMYTGVILGGVGGGWLGQCYGWRSAFLLLGILGVIYGAVLSLPLREAPNKKEELAANQVTFQKAFRELLTSRNYLALLFAAGGLAGAAYWIVFTWLPMFLYERYHMTLAMAGYTATFYTQIGSFAGVLLGGIVADRWSRRNPTARLLMMVIGFMIAGPFLFLMGCTSAIAILPVILIMFGVGRGVLDANNMPTMCQIVPPSYRATGYGVQNCAHFLVGGGMAAVAGAMKDGIGLGFGFQLSAALLIVSGLVLLCLRSSFNKITPNKWPAGTVTEQMVRAQNEQG